MLAITFSLRLLVQLCSYTSTHATLLITTNHHFTAITQALAGTSTGGFCRCKVLLPACPADGNQCIRIREKMPEFSSAVLSEGKTKLDLNEAKDSEWQWHQLGDMQVCTLLQTDNHTSTLTTHVFYRLDALPAAQPTASKH